MSNHHHLTDSGPFSFLNPTTRRRPFPEKDPNGGTNINAGSEDEIPKTDGNAIIEPTKEIKVDDVHQKWRSRDNRKGMWFPMPLSISPRHI